MSTELKVYFLFDENENLSFEEILKSLNNYSTDDIFNAINILVGNRSLKFDENGYFSRNPQNKDAQSKFVQKFSSQGIAMFQNNLFRTDLAILSAIYTGAPITKSLLEKIIKVDAGSFQYSLSKLRKYDLIKEFNGQYYCRIDKSAIRDITSAFDKQVEDGNENNIVSTRPHIQKLLDLLSNFHSGKKKINYGIFKADIVLCYKNGENTSQRGIRVDSNATITEIIRYYLIAEWGEKETCIFFHKPDLDTKQLVESKNNYFLSGSAYFFDDDNDELLELHWDDKIFGSNERLDYLLLRNTHPIIQLDIKDIGEWTTK